MIYNTPLIPFQTELISLLSTSGETPFQVFDGGIAAEDILASFKSLDNVEFGVINNISCTQSHAKQDVIIWNISVRIELISTYKGRKHVAEMINQIGECITRTEEIFNHNMTGRGYALLSLNIGDANMGSASHDGGITWQNGYIDIDYYLNQIK